MPSQHKKNGNITCLTSLFLYLSRRRSLWNRTVGDLDYSITTYEMKNGAKVIEKGNIVQIWKLFGGRWPIVLDVFAPIPIEKT